jgi:SulP family sulfate permease
VTGDRRHLHPAHDLGVIQGILIGVVLPLLMLISRVSRPSIRRLARDPRSDAYVDADRHEGLEDSSGVLVVRLDGPLFFADANRFRDGLNELVERQPEPIWAIVLDADAISQTDTDGADVVRLVAGELEGRGGTLALARVEPEVLGLWARAGTIDAIGATVCIRRCVRPWKRSPGGDRPRDRTEEAPGSSTLGASSRRPRTRGKRVPARQPIGRPWDR